MVYFSQRPATGKEPPDSREQARMERFKRRYGRNALYGIYGSVQEFQSAVRKDLALVMREVLETTRKKR